LKRSPYIYLTLLTFAALFLHGYHPGAEDAEIYIPGVEKILHPSLFPVGTEFFQSHAHMTLFPQLIAASVRLTHLPLDVALLLWHLATIFLFLLACWDLSGKVFTDLRARWGGVALVAALLTLPIAGTRLFIMDQYLNPRNLTAFAVILAVSKVLDRKYIVAALLLAFAATLHPFMTAFAVFFCVVLAAVDRWKGQVAFAAILGPLGFLFQPNSNAYHDIALRHASYHYLIRWHWYEMLGAVAPLFILWWCSRIAHAKKLRNLEVTCQALVMFGTICFVAGLVLSIPARFENLARLQPMRSLYLIYIMMFLFAGGLLAQFVLKTHVLRWLLLFVPVCAALYFSEAALFPNSARVEWPGAKPKNEWVQSFQWARDNTPVDAVFALDPEYMNIAGEDENGFRVTAQRSRLADDVKDSGAVSMFPQRAGEWLKQVQAQQDWKKFHAEDYERLRRDFGVTWIVVQQPVPAGLDCPYQNSAVQICRL
jgi:hypothetical protein